MQQTKPATGFKKGKTRQEIAEHFGSANKEDVKELLERAETGSKAGNLFQRSAAKGYSPKNAEAEQGDEISRSMMENQMLRDFLQLTESG